MLLPDRVMADIMPEMAFPNLVQKHWAGRIQQSHESHSGRNNNICKTGLLVLQSGETSHMYSIAMQKHHAICKWYNN